MNTCCPKCNSCYEIDEDALLKANCLAHCYRCGALFSVIGRHCSEVETADIELLMAALRLDQRCEVRATRPRPATTAPPAQLREMQEPTPVRAERSARTAPADANPLDNSARTATDGVAAPSPPPGLHAPAADETEPDQPPASPSAAPPAAPAQKPRSRHQRAPDRELPFAVPDDLEPLQPSPDAALDPAETLYERPARRGLLYGLLATLLLGALGLQLAWQNRAALLERLPALQPICDYVECRPSMVRAPERFRVLQRALTPTANTPGSLTLSATIRNDGDTPQPLPDMQLSLLDNDGAVVVRRRLSPADYLFPAPPADRLIAPGEVFTITLDFADPGYLATGFMIDFL